MRKWGIFLGLAISITACDFSGDKVENVKVYNTSSYATTMNETPEKPEPTDTGFTNIHNPYPDDPDQSIRHQLEGKFSHDEIQIDKISRDQYEITIFPHFKNKNSDTIIIKNIDILEFIPTFPEWIKDDAYMVKLGIINQEWNRQQVKFYPGQFEIKGTNLESKSLVRIDLARNCLSSYLWEVIAFAQNENGSERPCYHGWFNFPKDLYASLFLQRNKIPFQKYADHLEDWKDLKKDSIKFDLLRTLDNQSTKVFKIENKNLKNLNNDYYPLVGERKKKFKNIISPVAPASINDFLNDSTLFATFSPPGYYTKNDPRKTYLSKLAILDRIIYNKTTSHNTSKDETFELKLIYYSMMDGEITNLTIGGLNKDEIPTLSIEEAKDGFQMPMGISNHSFYETYLHMKSKPSKENPYYGILTDEEGKFIDSHWLGIDGPLFHWDDKKKDLLHIWIISFERHAFVGHYTIQF